MDVFGSFSLLLAFVCAVYAFVGGIAAIRTRHPLLVKSTRQAGMAACVLIFFSTISLEYFFCSTRLSIYILSVLIAYRNKNGELMPYVGVVLAGVQIFFLTLNNFVENPFKTLPTVGPSGFLDPFTRMDG